MEFASFIHFLASLPYTSYAIPRQTAYYILDK